MCSVDAASIVSSVIGMNQQAHAATNAAATSSAAQAALNAVGPAPSAQTASTDVNNAAQNAYTRAKGMFGFGSTVATSPLGVPNYGASTGTLSNLLTGDGSKKTTGS